MSNRKQHVIIELLERQKGGGAEKIHSKPHEPQGKSASAETPYVCATCQLESVP